MKATLIAALALASASFAPALAQAAPAGTAKAKQLVDSLDYDRKLESGFALLSPLFGAQMVTQLEANPASGAYVRDLADRLPGGRERLSQLLSEEYLAEMRKAFPAIKAELASFYASRFSEGEMDELIHFFTTGTGAKWTALEAAVQSHMKAVGERYGTQAGMAAGAQAAQRAEAEAGAAQR
jgi:Uncharacterized protein conserved in bacteria (DUF2059)